MNTIIDSFTEFWEVLTGVFDDNKAKIIRLVCFSLLAFGIMWAATNYFKADKISDTDVEFYRPAPTEAHADGAALKRIADVAQAVQDMRNGGEAIAATILAAHTKPFNIEGYNEAGLENLGEGGENFSREAIIAAMAANSSGDVVPKVEEVAPQAPAIIVKAVMLSGKNARAVIDTPTEKNKIIKRGEKLEGLGRVVRIKRRSITLRDGRQEFVYEIPELKSTLSKKSNTNSNKSNLGMEEFLFKGTVPADSPLAPTAKE